MIDTGAKYYINHVNSRHRSVIEGIRNDKFSSDYRNSFEAVTRLCIQIAYGNFDEDVARYDEDSEMNALEKYAAKFGPSFPVKAYSKVLDKIKRIEFIIGASSLAQQ